jgi:apoptosis-inducing factor 2
MAKTVLILGASFTGLKIAHSLLKNTAPVVKDLKIILVSPTTHAYFNLAAPRAIVPGQIPDEKILAPIEPAFSKYPSSKFEFVIGTAKSVDPAGKKVEIETESGLLTVAYDTLVVTTGSNTGGMPWKASGSHKQFLDVLHDTQEKVKKAKSIVVGGAGVTGVETAGELGFEYGKTKEITLVGHIINLPTRMPLTYQ